MLESTPGREASLARTLGSSAQLPDYVKERLRCILVDKKSLDFQREFVPSTKSSFASQLNKNGFRITNKPFTVFRQNVPPSSDVTMEPSSSGLASFEGD